MRKFETFSAAVPMADHNRYRSDRSARFLKTIKYRLGGTVQRWV